MWQYRLNINFLFVLFVITKLNSGFAGSNVSAESETISNIATTKTCKFMFCSCADFLKLSGVHCEGSADNYISKLTFVDYKNLTKGVLQGFHVAVLRLVDPEITVAENFLEGMISLDRIFVEQSSIQTVPDFRYVKYTITEIAICSSHLTSLKGNHLQNLILVSHLDFSKNFISEIGPDVFKGTEDVTYLDLSHNLLMYIPPKLMNNMKKLFEFKASHNNLLHVDSLLYVTKPSGEEGSGGSISFEYDILRRIVLRGNNITSANSILRFNTDDDCKSLELNDYFHVVFKVDLLDLRSNHIKETPKSFFSCYQLKRTDTPVYKVKQLLLDGNQLETLGTSLRYAEIHEIYMSGNNLTCDCHLHQVIGWIAGNEYPNTDTEVCLQSDLENSLQKLKDCPDMCLCRCAENSEDTFMFVDCSSKNLSVVPQFFKKNITEIKANGMITSYVRQFIGIDQKTYSFYFEDFVLGISLENNNLKSIDEADLPPNLTHLLFKNNKLSRFPESILTNQLNLKQVSLSGNPWKCDCNTLKFKNWLISKYNIILDIDKVICGISDTGEANLNGRVIWKLSDLDLCPMTDIGLFVVVYLSVLMSFIIIGLTAIKLYRKHEFTIKLFLYIHGFHFVKEANIGNDKKFDAFMSFSHSDDEFVITEVISAIEDKDPNICLCLHYRHFIAGELIIDNITYAVQNSKKTVMFLSRNFLDSEWCLLEFRTAFAQCLKDKVHRIIVVKIEDLPENIHPEIKLFLDTTTYITWGEKRFWEKLFFVLPSRNSIINPVPRHTGNNDRVFNCSSFNL